MLGSLAKSQAELSVGYPIHVKTNIVVYDFEFEPLYVKIVNNIRETKTAVFISPALSKTMKFSFVNYISLFRECYNSRQYVCINCGNPVPELYRKISATVLKITECDKCHNPADKYIEFEVLIILIDLVLLSKAAYRHILYNSDCKNLWKIGVIQILLEAYCLWTETFSKFTNVRYQSKHVDPFLAEKGFYVSSLHIFIGTVLLYTFVYLLTRLFHRMDIGMAAGKTYPLALLQGVILASISKFFFIPIIIWKQNATDSGMAIHILLVVIYFVISLIQIHSVISSCSWTKSAVIVLLAFLIKTYFLTEISLVLNGLM
ncbi:protein ARV1 [Toxorhynchites rutilus septentrionalis]|uniref:protein ARV1 n=1 Tax=Toxorhynchites rutilus septentrionalis TaxID=329112 RepID=UPI00247B1077|nr:protein ARV1 [Toxorhynchites rutilus septentrionalis]